MKKYYLKPNVVIEPLVERWYAWSHLISPATAAMNVVGRHLKIMQSYIQSPKVHQGAALNPKMRGGPFMDYKDFRVDEVRQLMEETNVRQAKLIQFAKSVTELDGMLKNNAMG